MGQSSTSPKTGQPTVFARACMGEETSHVPVWLMRQAGRYLPEYRALKERSSFWELCTNPDLAAQATLDAQRYLSTDAAIIFSDITIPGHAMGLPLEFAPGPRFAKSVRTLDDVKNLKEIDAARDLPYVMQAIEKTRAKLPSDVSLIGFTGAPFTLAAYMVEGVPSKTWVATKKLLYGSPNVFAALLERVEDAVVSHGLAQLKAGCDTIQLFDSHAGELPVRELEEVAFASAARAIARLKKHGAPVIYFARGVAHALVGAQKTGADVLGLDWSCNMAEARKLLGPKTALMGNLDPGVLFTNPQIVDQRVKEIIDSVRGEPGIIFNLGHGVLPETPPENALQVVKSVHKWSGLKQ